MKQASIVLLACLALSSGVQASGLIKGSRSSGGGSSLVINWTADAYYADGTDIGGAIVGFKTYCSTTRQDVNPTLMSTVANPSATGTTITGLTSGLTYYCSATTYTSNAESDRVHYPSEVAP